MANYNVRDLMAKLNIGNYGEYFASVAYGDVKSVVKIIADLYEDEGVACELYWCMKDIIRYTILNDLKCAKEINEEVYNYINKVCDTLEENSGYITYDDVVIRDVLDDVYSFWKNNKN